MSARESSKFDSDEQRMREEHDYDLLSHTVSRMANIFGDSTFVEKGFSRDPLLNACQIIGQRIDKVFHEPVLSKAQTIPDRIYEIAVASNVFMREVRLEKGWWHQDSGNLLGLNQNAEPLALLRERNNRYYAINTVEGTKNRVTKSQEIKDKAWFFYRSFPNKAVIGIKDIFRFSAFGRMRDFAVMLGTAMLAVLLALFFPFANKIVFDEVIPYLDQTLLQHVVMGLLVAALSILVISFTREYAILRIESYLNHDIETSIWERLLQLPVQFFRKYTVGNLLQRLTLVHEVRKVLSTHVVRVIINAILSILYLAVMIYFSLTLSLIGLAIVAIGMVTTIVIGMISQRWVFDYQEMQGKMSSKVLQMIFGLTKIRTNGAEDRIFASWAEDMERAQTLRLKMGKARNAVLTIDNLLDYLRYIAIFTIVIGMVYYEKENENYNQLSIGSYLAFMSAYLGFYTAMESFSGIFIELIFLIPMWKRAKVVLEQAPENTQEKIVPGILRGNIRVEHLYFRYGKDTPWIHEDLSFNIAAGEFVGIVGPSGCGKSTLVRLLVGFENPEQGALSVDGLDLSTINLNALRRQMGVILQTSSIMDGSINENITAGTVATPDEVEKAMHQSTFDKELKNFPMGLQTALFAGGITLSGGQRQKVLLARTFITQAPILIWDEATNFLDEESQNLVMQNLEKIPVTRLVIAHRLSALKGVDRILVMDKGKIVQQGTFNELSTQEGLFKEIFSKQEKSNR